MINVPSIMFDRNEAACLRGVMLYPQLLRHLQSTSTSFCSDRDRPTLWRPRGVLSPLGKYVPYEAFETQTKVLTIVGQSLVRLGTAALHRHSTSSLFFLLTLSSFFPCNIVRESAPTAE